MNEEMLAIDKEIQDLKDQLLRVQGSQTEVYSRIVGYYRSVKNWNLGKKEEYKNRTVFTKVDGKNTESELQEISLVTDKPVVKANSISGYSYFYRSSCPNCPAMKNVLDELIIEGDHLNVDLERGLEAASENMVFSAPTVIFRNENGDEIFRTGHPEDVVKLFSERTATA